MKILLIVILLPIFILYFPAVISPLYAASFTADAVQTRGENSSHSKMFWLNGKVRLEYTEDGVSMAKIFDNKNNEIIWLDNDNQYYLKREMSANEKITAGSKAQRNDDPCKEFSDAECIFLKQTTMNGRAAEKWLITLSNNGNDFHVFQWLDSKYKSILRQENSDGTGLSVDIKEHQEINGRKVRKLTMTAFAASGEQKQGVQWYDNELDIVVKQMYQNDVIDELRNIKVVEVSEKMFIVPDAYILFEPAMKAAQQDTIDALITDNLKTDTLTGSIAN